MMGTGSRPVSAIRPANTRHEAVRALVRSASVAVAAPDVESVSTR